MYQKKVQEQLEHIKRKGAKVKVFMVLREENHKADMMAKLVTSRIMKILVNIFIEVAKTLSSDSIIIGAIEEKED